MPFNAEDLQKARVALAQFRKNAVSPHHERYSFPFFNGSYFAYRKVDVMRVVAIAKSISNNPSYLDVGCGYGESSSQAQKGSKRTRESFTALASPSQITSGSPTRTG
jgi:hypothetical protein